MAGTAGDGGGAKRSTRGGWESRIRWKQNSLREVLRQAHSAWTSEELDAIEAKLGEVGIDSAAGLGSALFGGELKRGELRSVGVTAIMYSKLHKQLISLGLFKRSESHDGESPTKSANGESPTSAAGVEVTEVESPCRVVAEASDGTSNEIPQIDSTLDGASQSDANSEGDDALPTSLPPVDAQVDGIMEDGQHVGLLKGSESHDSESPIADVRDAAGVEVTEVESPCRVVAEACNVASNEIPQSASTLDGDAQSDANNDCDDALPTLLPPVDGQVGVIMEDGLKRGELHGSESPKESANAAVRGAAGVEVTEDESPCEGVTEASNVASNEILQSASTLDGDPQSDANNEADNALRTLLPPADAELGGIMEDASVLLHGADHDRRDGDADHPSSASLSDSPRRCAGDAQQPSGLLNTGGEQAAEEPRAEERAADEAAHGQEDDVSPLTATRAARAPEMPAWRTPNNLCSSSLTKPWASHRDCFTAVEAAERGRLRQKEGGQANADPDQCLLPQPALSLRPGTTLGR